MIVSGSFSSESAIIQNGFSLLPQDFSLEAYKTVFKDPMVVFRAYGTTIGLTIVGTVLGLLLQTMTAYVLSRKEFEWRNQFSFFFYFTTLFSGGLVPYYVLMTQTLNLRDSYLALLLPLLFSVYNLLIMKSYIVGLPDSLITTHSPRSRLPPTSPSTAIEPSFNLSTFRMANGYKSLIFAR